MPRQKRRFPVNTILPEYGAAERFCYFLDLYNDSDNIPLSRHKKQLAAAAHAGLIAPINTALAINKGNDNEVISSAINFLTNVAASERAKEIKVIKRYLEEIKSNKLLVSILNSKQKERRDLDNLIKDLENFSNNPHSGIDLTNFYSKLTLLINSVRNSIESFQERLDQLLDKNRSSTREIRGDFFATRVAGDIDTLMRNLTGTVQREKETALSTRIVNALITYANQNLASSEIFLENPVEVLTALMIDFEKFLQTEYDRLGLGNELKLEEMDIEQIFEKYTESEDTFLAQLRQNNQEVLDTLRTIRQEMGIKELKRAEEAATQRQATLDKVNSSRRRSTNPLARKRINSILKANGRQEISNFMTWNVTTKNNNRHGTVYELILPVVERALKVQGHAATDVITIDIGKVDLNIDLSKMIRTEASSIRTVIEQQAKMQRKDRQDDLIEYVQQMNADIQTSINTLNNLLKENEIPEDIFIYHQSLKLYTQIEEHKTAQFHGREMQVLNLLDNLYSLNNIQGLTLVNQDIMYGAILNLCSLSIGGGSKSLIENYLSMFAGMLMFDDLQVMAWDVARTATQQVTSSGQAYNIHLYLVNDIYVPGSLILTTISQALQAGYNHISAQNGAKVTLDTSEADASIGAYLSARSEGMKYNIGQWDTMGEKVAKGIKAQITFLSSFFSFLKDIQSYIG